MPQPDSCSAANSNVIRSARGRGASCQAGRGWRRGHSGTYLVCRGLIERPSLLRTRLIEKIEHALGILHTHWRGDVLELERLLEREIEPLHLGELQRRLRVEFVARPLCQCARNLGHLRIGVNGAVIRIRPVDRAGEHLDEASDAWSMA